MSKEKQARRAAAGPMMNPQAMSMQMGTIPGMPQGPGNIMLNGMNPMSYGPQVSTMRPDGMNMHPYNDTGDRYSQMGAEILNPMNVPRSQVQQNTPITPVGNNGGVPYGMQMQPPAEQADMMESTRLGQEVQMKGGMPSPMGYAGNGPVMGAMPSEMTEQTAATLPLMGMAPPVDGQMVPGATPQKQGKKRGKK